MNKNKTKPYTLRSIKKYNASVKGRNARKRYYIKNREKILERARNKRKKSKNISKITKTKYNTIRFIYFKEPITIYFD